MPSLESAAEYGACLLRALTLKSVRFHILQRFFLADPYALWISVAKVTFVRKTEVMGKGH